MKNIRGRGTVKREKFVKAIFHSIVFLSSLSILVEAEALPLFLKKEKGGCGGLGMERGSI
jgi:hypothetical protein